MNKIIPRQTVKYIIGIAALLAAVALLIIVVNQTRQPDTATQSTPAPTTAQTSTETPDVITYTAKSGSSALDQLKVINNTVVVKETDMGSYVDGINGLAGGTDGKYWSFYIDGEMASVGAGEFMPRGGEKIEWKFQKL